MSSKPKNTKVTALMIMIPSLFVVFVGSGLAIYMSQKPDNSSGQQNSQAVNQFQSIKDELSASTAMLVDVRTEEEFNAGHIKDATLVPLANIQAGDYSKLSKDKKLYIYCRSGNRSAQATQLLTKAGFNNIKDLGSMEAVLAIGATKAD